MEIKVLENKKNRVVFEIVGEDHSFCNVLKKELLNDEHVKIATYAIEHPLISQPKMIVETDGEEVSKALKEAAKRVGKKAEKFKEEFTKAVK
jgi:DNA-directed RNA polymerase subunit L